MIGCGSSREESRPSQVEDVPRARPTAAVPPPPRSTLAPPPRGGPPRSGASSRSVSPNFATSRANPAQWNDTPHTALRPPKPWSSSSSSKAWTKSKIEKERKVFWDTQVTNDPEAWNVLKSVVEVMQRDGNSINEAQALLDAAGLNSPTGYLVDGVWDERGRLYKLPKWIVSDPNNLLDDSRSSAAVGQSSEDASDEQVNGDDADTQEKFKLRARLSDRAQDVLLDVNGKEKVKHVVSRVLQAGQYPNGTRISLAYMGRILDSEKSLFAQGWATGNVVNAMVFDQT